MDARMWDSYFLKMGLGVKANKTFWNQVLSHMCPPNIKVSLIFKPQNPVKIEVRGLEWNI